MQLQCTVKLFSLILSESDYFVISLIIFMHRFQKAQLLKMVVNF